MKNMFYVMSCLGMGLLFAACSDAGEQTSTGENSGSSGSSSSSGSSGSSTSSSGGGNGCMLTNATTATSEMSPSGCAIRERDTSACKAEREGAGLSGFWLDFSCRVKLSVAGTVITAQSDGLPDYESNYFPSPDACHEEYSGAIQNPNLIKSQTFVMNFPQTPSMTSQKMMGATVGMVLNGVSIFGNFAAPGDDIYKEAMTFDRCGGHPQMTGVYHNHSEPFAVSYDDSNFIGVMRDGYPIYGRKDMDGTYPTVDQFGGHSGKTVHSPNADVYHYHVNEQTSMNPGSVGQKQWFLTTGTYRGTPGSCMGCM